MNIDVVLIKGTLPMTVAIATLLILLYVIARKLKRIFSYSIGRRDNELYSGTKKLSVSESFKAFNDRIMKDRAAALNHSLIMIGFFLVILGFLLNVAQVILNTAGNLIFLQGSLFKGVSILTNIGALMLFSGSGLALVRRLSGKLPRLEKSPRHTIPLVIFIFSSLTSMVFEGFKGLLYENGNIYSFMGYLIVSPVRGLPADLSQAYIYSWYLLSVASITMVFSLVTGKMPHMSAAMFNVINKKDLGLGRLKSTEKQINDFYGNNREIDENSEFGTKYIEDLSRNQLTQLDACAECGRCDSVCPANLSNKKLTPKKLVLANRKSFNNFKGKKQSAIVNSQQEMVWECSMCYACENECPSLVDHVDRIAGIRRSLIMNSGEVLPEHKKVLTNVIKHGNPFGLDVLSREELTKELGISYLEKGKQVDYVLWLGCYAYFDGRMKSVIKSMINILKEAGKSFAVLKEETCCGDPVRRIGDEFRFQEILSRNKQIFRQYEVKHILTVCPHCLNTFKSEYPSLGCTINASHYLEVLSNLIKLGSRPAKGKEKKRVFYHDSCYLGRINNLYHQPRQLLEYVKNDYELVTIEGEKEDSLCCGGGGGRIWCDEKPENRPSILKVNKLKDKNIDIIATSCPYCLSIFSDARGTEGLPVEVVDLVELLDGTAGALKR